MPHHQCITILADNIDIQSACHNQNTKLVKICPNTVYYGKPKDLIILLVTKILLKENMHDW